jgi:hypothetical protein
MLAKPSPSSGSRPANLTLDFFALLSILLLALEGWLVWLMVTTTGHGGLGLGLAAYMLVLVLPLPMLVNAALILRWYSWRTKPVPRIELVEVGIMIAQILAGSAYLYAAFVPTIWG